MKIILGISKSCVLLIGKHPGCSGLPTGGSVVKNQPAYAGDTGDVGLIPGSGRSPWRRKRQPTPIFLPGKFYGQRSLTGYSPWGRKDSGLSMHMHVLYSYNIICPYWYYNYYCKALLW